MQTLIDEEFQGIVHLRTSTFNKKVASARHDFIKLSGSENKLEALLQVSMIYHLGPSSYLMELTGSIFLVSFGIIWFSMID